jgi:uncharacterized membrane protein HdeD (DUF308 family)
MQDIARNVARETVPWKAGQSWWVVGIEGIIVLAVGVYIVSNPTGANDVIRFLIAIVLLVDSLGQIVDGFQLRGLPSSPWAALRGGVGASVAVLTLLSGQSTDIGDLGARQMLAVGLLAYGILGILALVFTLRSTEFKIGAVIANVLLIVLGILLLTADPGDTDATRWLGAVAIVGGIALLAYSWMLRGKTAG